MENRRPPSTRSAGNPKKYTSSRRDSYGGDGYRSRSGPASNESRRPYGKQYGGYSANRGSSYQKGGPVKRKSGGSWDRRSDIKITSELQLTDGKYRGKFLKTNPSPKMVPTRGRLRQLFFKILSARIRAGRFLDLCAGCGTMGLEAISRGAMLATFVERSARMASLVKRNLEEFGIRDGHAEIIEGEVAPFLKKMLRRRRYWDVVYFCVPNEGADEIFGFLRRGAAVARGGVLIVEHASDLAVPEELGVLKRGRVFTQDNTALTFYERPLPPASK